MSNDFEIRVDSIMDLERLKKSPLTYNGRDVVNTLASSFLQMTRAAIRSRISSKFSEIRP